MRVSDFDTDYFSRQCHLSNCLQLWNRSAPEPFMISEDLFTQNITGQETFDFEASLMVYEQSDLIGFILVKTWRDAMMLHADGLSRSWISLLFVAPDNRRKGLGTLLVNQAVSVLKQKAIARLELGKDTYNFFPGLASCFLFAKPFFAALGFTEEGVTHDLIRHCDAQTQPLPVGFEGVTLRQAKRYDFKRLERFFAAEFPGRWHYEFTQYCQKGGSGKEFWMVLEKGRVMAFCRLNGPSSIEQLHNVNWSLAFKRLYGIGPLGVAQAARGRGLGYLVTAHAFNQALIHQADAVVIDWTSKVAFYEKFGFHIWQTYCSMGLALEG